MKKKIDELVVDPEATVREALQRLCANSKRVLFVVENGKLSASLADGDYAAFC